MLVKKNWLIASVIMCLSGLAQAQEQGLENLVRQVHSQEEAQERKCLTEATEAQTQNVYSLVDRVDAHLNALEISEAKAGRQLKVVLLARDASMDMNDLITELRPDRVEETSHRSLNALDDEGVWQDILEYCGKNKKCQKNEILKIFKPRVEIKQQFFHIGLAFRQHLNRQENWKWTVTHMLRPCQKDAPNAKLTDLFGFFLDLPKNYQARVIMLPQWLQDRLQEIADGERADNGRYVYTEMLADDYNALAVPFENLRDQNSNQFILEVIAVALKPKGRVQNRSDAQRVLQETNYAPLIGLLKPIKIGGIGIPRAVARALAPRFMGQISLRDQKFQSFNMIEIVSADSVVQYLSRNGLVTSDSTLSIPKKELKADLPNKQRVRSNKPK
ncbi:MAG: DUF2145 domain-containing protein [Pseudobdellovibrionaceae bacterium]